MPEKHIAGTIWAHGTGLPLQMRHAELAHRAAVCVADSDQKRLVNDENQCVVVKKDPKGSKESSFESLTKSPRASAIPVQERQGCRRPYAYNPVEQCFTGGFGSPNALMTPAPRYGCHRQRQSLPR